MKKSLLYLFMLICSVSLFTGCSDDDDNGGGDLAMALQSSVVGTYEGDLRVVYHPHCVVFDTISLYT